MANGSGASWFCQSPEGNKGPFTQQQVLELVANGSLPREAMVWRDGLPNWVRVADVPELAVPVAQTGPAQPGAVPAAPSQDDYMDAVFVGLVKDSWKRYRKREVASDVDEVVVGAVITATLDNGYALIDLESSGTNHYLRFEELSTGNRIIFKLQHHAESLLTATVLGHEASVTIGFGQRVKDFQRVWTAVKQEMKGGYITTPDPGIILVDGDISSQYIYVEVGLLWDINDYLDPGNPYLANYPKLTRDVGATVYALRKYLAGRLG